MTHTSRLVTKFLVLVATTLFWSGLPPKVCAHPHVFVENKLDVVFDENGLAGFQVTWVFDDMFTILILEDVLELSDTPMEAKHVPIVKEQAFDYLKEHDYFTEVSVNKDIFKVQFVKDFNARIENEKLVCEFFVPCHIKAVSGWKTVTVAQYDPTFYSALTFVEDPISVKGAEGFQVQHETAINNDKSYYFGMLHPWETQIKFKRADG